MLHCISMRQKAKAIIHVFPFEYTSILLLLLLMWISLGKYRVCFIPSNIPLQRAANESFGCCQCAPFSKRPEYLHLKRGRNISQTACTPNCSVKVPNISIFKKTRIEERPQYLHFQKGQNIPNQNICAKFYTSLESFIHLGSAAKDWQKNSCKRYLYKILQWVAISPSW